MKTTIPCEQSDPRLVRVALAAALMILAALLVRYPAVAQGDSATVDEVKRESAEALEAMKRYSFEKRDQVTQEVKATLTRLDTRIDELENRLERKSAEMTEEVRARSKTQLRALRRQRTELAEWYGGIKHSSSETWDDVKDGLAGAYEAAAESLTKAWRDF